MDRIVYEIEARRMGAGWSARCPELEVTAFGDTQEDARTSLRRQVSDYLEDCEEMGVLEEVLIEARLLRQRGSLDEQSGGAAAAEPALHRVAVSRYPREPG